MGSAGGEALSVDLDPTDGGPARPWRRLAALAIDAATVATVLWVLVVLHVLWFMDDWSARIQPGPWGRGFVATLAFCVLAMVYETVFVVANHGQTPGKDIMNLRVVGSSGGGPIGPLRALARGLPLAVVPFVRPVSLLVIVAVVHALLLCTAGRRSLSDRLAATDVVAYDRDAHDPTARRPSSRRRRLADDRTRNEPAPVRRRRVGVLGAGER